MAVHYSLPGDHLLSENTWNQNDPEPHSLPPAGPWYSSPMNQAGLRPPVLPIRFGIFEVDLVSGELRKRGVKIKLQEQPFQVLAALVRRPNEVVTREELQKRLW